MIEPAIAYDALTSRDPRFDGIFFVGVTSTGIYCRPVCPVKTPQQKNCRFFSTPESAEKAGFRPCLRCRPELAPGVAPVDDAMRIAHLLAHRVNQGMMDGTGRLEEIAAQFELSPRQLRRIITSQLGVSPIELLQTRRLLLAKQLLTETGLPVTEIAFASGFSSLRRFNDAFRTHYGMPPTRLRKEAASHAPSSTTNSSTLQLTYRPPYDWASMLEFLQARALRGIEHITGQSYARTVRVGEHKGWIKVTHKPEKHALMVEFTHSLLPVLPNLLRCLRNLFDLDARPDVISAHLMKDSLLKNTVMAHPGLRVPGAFDGFEMAVRAILGQQITVKAATTIACRMAEAFGERAETPWPELSRLSPTAERMAAASEEAITSLGIIGARARSIIALAKAQLAGHVRLEAGIHPDNAIRYLTTLPGIGQWTAHYIAMRGLRWPDAFPKEDIALRKGLGGMTAKQAEERSQPWRPWRSYAVLHLWKSMTA
ncbi:DNA-3-methyladenine glycosylase 2 [bacterium]|nr:DNA-3-methyladenine glycosylase 2 [bacterium]